MFDAYEGKPLSPNTLKLYNSALTYLLGKDFKDLDKLKDFDEVQKLIEQKKAPSTKRTHYSAIVTALKGRDGFKEIYDKAHSFMMKINKETPLTDTKSKSQSQNWMSFEDLKALRDAMETSVTAKIKKEKKAITTQTYNQLLDLVILSLYTLQQPRRSVDYHQMLIGKGDNKQSNYLDKTNFIFNNYKTSGTYSQQVVPITPEMLRVLKVYLKYHSTTDKHFLIRADGSHIQASSAITHILNRVTGKKISTSLIRNIFATSEMGSNKKEFKEVMEKLQKTADNMSTSVNVLINQYTKKE